MERYIGMDVHAASCTLAVIFEKGRTLRDFPVETNGQALIEAIRMIPGHKHLVMEEGLQSAWLYETPSPHVDDLVAKLRVGNLETSEFKAPSQFTRPREYARSHMTLVSDVARVQARITLVYRSRGVFIGAVDVYSPRRREPWLNQLP